MEERDKLPQEAASAEVPEQWTGSTRREFVTKALGAASLVAAGSLIPGAMESVNAQSCSEDPFPQIMEIPSDENGKLRAILRVKNTTKTIPGFTGNPTPMMRYFEGQSTAPGSPVWPSAAQKGACLPGPTFCAKIGDFVEISFFNEVNVGDFPGHTLDNAETGFGTGCDLATNATLTPADKDWYPGTRGDSFPNCFHGSSTANLHFHGMHVTPDAFGDNVLVQVRPDPKLNEKKVQQQFQAVFAACEKNHDIKWKQVPSGPGTWATGQQAEVSNYDLHAIWGDTRGPVNGKPALPEKKQLAPVNESLITDGEWPEYFIGAYPNCFRVTPEAGHTMGQAPGTNWYHAHKHGSTSINLYNGMAGVLLIRGDYDKGLKAIYPGLKERVMIVQRFTDLPNLERAAGAGPITLVNGVAKATIQMAPGEVQLWRIVNGMVENTMALSFTASAGATVPAFRQIAQDGLQFNLFNYQNQPFTTPTPDPSTPGFNNGTAISLGSGGRVDILVQAPNASEGATFAFGTIASVVICGSASRPAQSFPTAAQYELLKFPAFLKDLPHSGITRKLDFGWEPFRVGTGPASNTGTGSSAEPNSHTKLVPFKEIVDGQERIINVNRAPFFMINNKQFDQQGDAQHVGFDTIEEWELINTTGLAHPFHIHVNPFQVTEIFDPNKSTTAPIYTADQNGVWQDVVLIPAALISNKKLVVDSRGIATTPGRVRFRSRFCDFPGTFVLHCHILAHEDRGMMMLVQVSKTPSLKHVQHH